MTMNHNVCAVILLMTISMTSTDDIHFPPACEIYCRGRILDIVQRSSVYSDSKTFVDMKMRYTQEEINYKFEILLNETEGNPSKFMIKKFIREYFSAPGTELELCVPSDWKDEPKFINEINDRLFRRWAFDLHTLWKRLCRKVKDEVRDNANLYSVVYVPNPVIIPGGRYREYYYWDSYWIILGLLRSEMFDTARGMLENFLVLVNTYGFVPNGGRIYYLQRSQPPLLIPMVYLYYSFTNDKQFIMNHIGTLEKEFSFWMNNRSTTVKFGNESVNLASYNVQFGSGPRPEAYISDITTAELFSSDEEKETFFFEIKSAAESGWAFSSRWFVKNGSRKGQIENTKTTSIIPVDLNAILCWNAGILSNFYRLLGNAEKAVKYKKIFISWKEAMMNVLWCPEDGTWYDYDKSLKQKRKYFYASNLAPLWTGCYNKSMKDDIATEVVKYLRSVNLTDYKGGVPTSFVKSDQKWDYPYAIPPLQYIIIIGLLNIGTKDAKDIAFDLAFNWIRSNFKGYVSRKSMFDTYDARYFGKQAGNKDYDIQAGFGWSNGICIELLYIYGKVLHSKDIDTANYKIPSIVLPGITTVVLVFIC